MSREYVFEADDEADTQSLARRLAALLPGTAVVALNGTLGAGKTRFVQALAEAIDVEPHAVTSPTFVLIQEYVGSTSIYHFDVYRLHDDDEFLDLGPEEYFARPGWSVIEWAERVARCLPREHLEIRIEVTGETSRRFYVIGHGGFYGALVDQLA